MRELMLAKTPLPPRWKLNTASRGWPWPCLSDCWCPGRVAGRHFAECCVAFWLQRSRTAFRLRPARRAWLSPTTSSQPGELLTTQRVTSHNLNMIAPHFHSRCVRRQSPNYGSWVVVLGQDEYKTGVHRWTVRVAATGGIADFLSRAPVHPFWAIHVMFLWLAVRAEAHAVGVFPSRIQTYEHPDQMVRVTFVFLFRRVPAFWRLVLLA